MEVNHTSQTGLKQDSKSSFGFVLVVIYLVLEYLRPQDTVGAISALRPGMVVSILMAFSWKSAGNFRSLWTGQSLRIILFQLLLLIHVPFAVNTFHAYRTANGFLLLLPFCISIVLFVDSIARLHKFMQWWCFLAFALAALGFLGKGIAGSSFLADENDYSLLMNMMLPFTFCLAFHERKLSIKIVYLTAVAISVAGIVVSNSRGGFVGLLVVLLVIWLGSPRKLLSLVVVSALAIGVYATADSKYWDRISTIEKTNEGTAKERLDSWEAGWEMFKDNPLGVGPGNFLVRFDEYQPESMPHSMWGRAAHSLYFTLLPELGIPGAIIYFSLLFVNIRDLRALRKLPQRDENARFLHLLSLALIAGLAGYFVCATFLSVLYYPHYWYFTAIIVACGNIARNMIRPSSDLSRAEQNSLNTLSKG